MTNIDQEGVGVKESLIKKAARILIRPFGYEAYKHEMHEGKGFERAVIVGLMQAYMPYTYSVAEDVKNRGGYKSHFKEAMFATVTDLLQDMLTMTHPEYAIARYIYGQVVVAHTEHERRKYLK